MAIVGSSDKNAHASSQLDTPSPDDGIEEVEEEEEEREVKVEGSVFTPAPGDRDDDLPPKIYSPMQMIENRIPKQMIKPGHGNTPAKYSTCFIHYRAWIEATKHKFEDTTKERSPKELVIGQEKKGQEGLAMCVASMKSGENALFHVPWRLGYGEEGSFSFPNVPPKANLIYEVELIGFDEAKEGKLRAEMTVEERIEAADRRKADGNQFFKEEKIQEAMTQYEMALAYIGDEFMLQLFGKYRDMAMAVKNPCHLNLAACFLKLNRYPETIAHCNMVLVEDDKNAKALFRRGKARLQLGQTDQAREDFSKLKKLAPEDKAVARELQLIAKHDRELYTKQKELYKGLFGNRSLEEPKQLHWYWIIWDWVVSKLRHFIRIRRKDD